VGEVRDEETARISVQAALTGHLVLSSLHTNDAVGAIARLRDFGVPPFAINNALLCALAQRLVRKLCTSCALPESDADLLRQVPEAFKGGTFKRPDGCALCKSTGFKGRAGVYEMLRMTPTMQQAIEAGASREVIREVASDDGMRPLFTDGLAKAALGITSLSEALRLRGLSDECVAASVPELRSAA
jgi:type II secretory ATPase GspE/PulE/Tfp pilus assembly ATPase PilB-like protein